jgi:hypothetical protein
MKRTVSKYVYQASIVLIANSSSNVRQVLRVPVSHFIPHTSGAFLVLRFRTGLVNSSLCCVFSRSVRLHAISVSNASARSSIGHRMLRSDAQNANTGICFVHFFSPDIDSSTVALVTSRSSIRRYSTLVSRSRSIQLTANTY